MVFSQLTAGTSSVSELFTFSRSSSASFASSCFHFCNRESCSFSETHIFRPGFLAFLNCFEKRSKISIVPQALQESAKRVFSKYAFFIFFGRIALVLAFTKQKKKKKKKEDEGERNTLNLS